MKNVNVVLKRILEKIPSKKRRFHRISSDISAQIQEYLRIKGYNQKDFSALMGKKQSEISKWLTGNHNFTIKTIAAIEDELDEDIVCVPIHIKNTIEVHYFGISNQLPTAVHTITPDYSAELQEFYLNFQSAIPIQKKAIVKAQGSMRKKAFSEFSEGIQTYMVGAK